MNMIQQNFPNILPKFFKLQLKLTPAPLKNLITEKLFNHLFAHSLQDDELEFLENKTLVIKVSDIDYELAITVQDQRIVIVRDWSSADVILTSTFNPLILLASRKEDPDTLFFHRKLSIEGNTAIVLEVKNWLDSLDMDVLPTALQKTIQGYANCISIDYS